MATDSPASPRPLLDFGRAFQFFFEDREWVKKILIGSGLVLLGIVLVGSILLAGYLLRLIRRSAAGDALPLPEFDDWGGMLVDGLRMAAVYLGHLLAVLAAPMLMFAVAFLMTGSFAGDNRGAGPVFGFIIAFAYLVMMVLMLLVFLYVPAALARLAQTDSVGAAFDVRANIAFIRRNVANYGITLLLYLVTSFVGQFGVLLCCVGVLPASFWAACVASWGVGQVLRLDTQPQPVLARTS